MARLVVRDRDGGGRGVAIYTAVRPPTGLGGGPTPPNGFEQRFWPGTNNSFPVGGVSNRFQNLILNDGNGLDCCCAPDYHCNSCNKGCTGSFGSPCCFVSGDPSDELVGGSWYARIDRYFASTGEIDQIFEWRLTQTGPSALLPRSGSFPTRFRFDARFEWHIARPSVDYECSGELDVEDVHLVAGLVETSASGDYYWGWPTIIGVDIPCTNYTLNFPLCEGGDCGDGGGLGSRYGYDWCQGDRPPMYDNFADIDHRGPASCTGWHWTDSWEERDSAGRLYNQKQFDVHFDVVQLAPRCDSACTGCL